MMQAAQASQERQAKRPDAPAEAAESDEPKFDSYNAGEFMPELYQATGEANGVDGFGSIGDAELELYRQQGFLVVHNAFSPAEVEAALAGLLDLIDGKAPGFRGIQYELGARGILDTIPRAQRQDYVRKLVYYVEHDARLKALSEHPKLQAVTSRIVGDAPFLFADQALLKPPVIGREKPWHQDHAFFNVPMGTPVVGCWIALDRAVQENGCMHVIPGSHREGPVIHFKRRDFQICDTSVATQRILAVPLEPGGCLLFDGLLHHGTPPTRSSLRRRALQFHYIPAAVGRITTQERLAVFGAEGKDVEC